MIRSVLVVVLMAGSLVFMTGTAQCNRVPCNPGDPGYDPFTGTCPSTQPGDTTIIIFGPPVPGTGGLPTQPGTEVPPDAGDNLDPDSVNLAIFGLNGLWEDNGRETCVVHTGSGVMATYTSNYECDPQDGGPVQTTLYDFEGDLTGNQLVGKTVVCRFGFQSDNGIIQADMVLVLSPDGKTLSGTWHNNDLGTDVPFSVVRKTVGNCMPDF